MKVFHDQAGRAWALSINVSTVKRARAYPPNVDMPGLFDEEAKGLAALSMDAVVFTELLWVLVMDEARERNVSQEDFEQQMFGDSLEEAMAGAFLPELIGFFPEPKKRAALGKVLTKMLSLKDKLMDRATGMVDAIDVEDMANRSMSSLTTPRGSSDSVPIPTHSAN